MSRRACLLCGAEDQETIFLLVRWIEPIGGQSFTSLPRCVDRVGCRARVEARGERWEVADGTPASEPMKPSEPPPAHEPTDLEEVFA